MASTATITRKSYKTTNPATGEVIHDYGSLTDDELEQKLAKAHETFLTWRDTPIEKRVELFRKVADLIDAKMPELSRQTTIEMGKPVSQAAMEGGIASEMFRYYADNGPELLKDEEVKISGASHTVVTREATGVILGIEPWNAPLYQPMRATAPNLFLGNTVVVKPAEICAGSTLMFDEIFLEAGFPEGAYQTVLIDRHQVSSLIQDDRVRGVTLTGSDAAGSIIGEQAGRAIKPVVLELGGSDAFVVLESADVAAAAGIAGFCRLIIGGQACALPKRVIVADSVADEFIEQYVAYFDSQVLGDGLDPATTLGPLSSASAVQILQEQYDDAVAKGATVLLPGGRVDDRAGFYFKPAVLTGITKEMRLGTEEAFGPLGIIYRFSTVDEAIEIANDTKYGLGGTVYGEVNEARRVAGRLDTGGVGINCFLGSPVEIPFGGTKASGVGRELGRTGMDQFANIKTYAIA
ncbi:MAG: aldehyde dehydrogenase-like protein yneI [Subtercola sp.]|nr:aldehyde dehydrogenase-like protein yneI [Subtercola sp.]